MGWEPRDPDTLTDDYADTITFGLVALSEALLMLFGLVALVAAVVSVVVLGLKVG